jgi:hypothetical protein
LDNAKNEIRVNAVCPSWVAIPMIDRSLKRWPALDQLIKTKTPLGRPADSEEVANVVVFLCSPSSSHISGTGVMIDSGKSRWKYGRKSYTKCNKHFGVVTNWLQRMATTSGFSRPRLLSQLPAPSHLAS